MKCACIARHRGEYPVRLMCRVLEVSPSGYYVWRTRSPSARAIADERLLLNVRVAYTASGETYGAPRVHQALRAAGVGVGKKRVARLMQRAGLVGRAPRRHRPQTTDANHPHPIAPNLVERRFAVCDPAGERGWTPDQVWVADITYVPTAEGWLYLAVVLDLGSRRVVGWATGATPDAALALTALEAAVAARRPAPGLLHHSDRGVQYACGAYRARLAAYGMRASMSRKGNCWDNAVAESFFATLEAELIAGSDWATRGEARQAIFEYIATWYNTRRLHSTLGYLSPAEYERRLHEAA